MGLTINVFGQSEVVQHHTGLELNLNTFQLNSSIVNDIFGSQLRLTAFLNERTELLNSGSVLFRSSNTYFQNDFRIRLWGESAGKWHPGFAAELGYLYQNKDWLRENQPEGDKNQHGFLFGGTWYFPLKILDKGFVLAKWCYALKPNNTDMTIFNCYVHWNILKKIGFHVGGDIYNEFKNLKYSGFVVGFSYQFTNKNKVE
jgi:hypothetical protein